MDKIYVTIGEQTQRVTLADNAAAKALAEKLQQGAVKVTLNSSGGFEIWAHEIESPVLLIHGEKAHSRYFSEYAFEKMTGKNPDGKSITIGNKELMIIPDAVHTDLYDDKNGKIPYDKMEEFFKTNLK